MREAAAAPPSEVREAAGPQASPSPGPEGEAVIRTIAMPADTNPAGDIFGG